MMIEGHKFIPAEEHFVKCSNAITKFTHQISNAQELTADFQT